MRLIVGLGAVFAVMNACFYVSIDRLPLATVAAIEFIGPIVLAAVGARVGRNFAAVALATAGVYLLTHVRFEGDPVGVGVRLRERRALHCLHRARASGRATREA